MATYIVKKSSGKINISQNIQAAIKKILPDYALAIKELKTYHTGDFSQALKGINERITFVNEVFNSQDLTFTQVEYLHQLTLRKINKTDSCDDISYTRLEQQNEEKQQAQLLIEYINQHFMVLRTITNNNFTPIPSSQTSGG